MLSHDTRATLPWLLRLLVPFTQLEAKRPSSAADVSLSLFMILHEHWYASLQISPGLHCSGQLHHCSHPVHPSTVGVCGSPDEGCQPWKRDHELPHGMRQVSVDFSTMRLCLVHACRHICVMSCLRLKPLLLPANAADLLHPLIGWMHNGARSAQDCIAVPHQSAMFLLTASAMHNSSLAGSTNPPCVPCIAGSTMPSDVSCIAGASCGTCRRSCSS